MGQPARSEEEEQKTFRTTQPLQWPDLVLAGALVGAFSPSVKNELDRAVSINDSGTCDAPLLSFERLFTEHRALNNISGSCASIVNTSRAHRLALPLQLLSQLIRYFAAPKGSIGSPDFGLSGASRATPRLNGTGKTPDSHHTPCAASVLRSAIVTMVST